MVEQNISKKLELLGIQQKYKPNIFLGWTVGQTKHSTFQLSENRKLCCHFFDEKTIQIKP